MSDPYLEAFLKQIPEARHREYVERLISLFEEYEINKDGPDITNKGIPKLWYGKKKTAYDEQMDKHLKKIQELNDTMPAFMQEAIKEATVKINKARVKVDECTLSLKDTPILCRTKDDLYRAIKELSSEFTVTTTQLSIRELIEDRT